MAWNRGSGGPSPVKAKAKPSPVRGLIAGFAVVALAGVCYFAFRGGDGPAPDKAVDKKPAAIKEVTPAPAPQAVEETPPETPKKPRFSMRSKEFRNLTPEQREAKYEEHLAEMKIPEASTNRAFRTGLEQVMSWIFTTELGDAPPPLPPISNFDLVHFEEIMNLRNEVGETDGEKTAEAKQVVEQVKKEMKEYVAKGGDPQKFLEYYHSELVRAHQEQEMARSQVMEVIKTDPDIALDYLDKVNAALKEKGIKGVAIGERTLRRYGLTLEGRNSEERNTEK